MADIAGSGGNFTSISGFNAHFSGWAANLVVTLVENTGFAENGNRTSEPCAQIMIGSATGKGVISSSFYATGVTGATPSMSGYKGTITLTAYSGQTCSFPANVSNVAIARPNDGMAELTLNFQSSGAITGAFGT